jgi:hypothetical protein
VEAFSLSHAQFLDGSTDFVTAALATGLPPVDQDVYGVSEGSLSPSPENYVNTGDDQELSRWNWLTSAEIAIKAGYISFPLIARMTGQALTSSGAGAARIYSQELWHEDSFNVPALPMILVMPSKDSDAIPRRLVVGVYKFQPSPMTFDGPVYKDGLKANYNGVALPSLKDEKGAVFPDAKHHVAKLISIQ